jgi:hypothetical protein
MTSIDEPQLDSASGVGVRFARAFTGHDAASIAALLTDDVVFHSPITRYFQIEGREAAIYTMRLVMASLDRVAFDEPLVTKGRIALPFSARVRSRPIKAIAVFELTPDGLIRDIQPLVAPLHGVAAFAAAFMPLVARPRGRAASAALALLFRSLASGIRCGDRLMAPVAAKAIQAAMSDPTSIRYTRS